jgi:tRNA threonylcarbamoyladenosine biosynthesis protein TsaB
MQDLQVLTTPPFSDSTRLLALDCAGDTLALALTQGEQVLAVQEAPGGAQASAALLPLVQGLLATQGWVLSDLHGLAFGRGPGAFTGLRTACAVAQGLGLGLGKPLLSIDSLLIVAEDARARAEPALTQCTVVVDARMGEVYHAQFAWGDGGWRTLREPALARPESLLSVDGWAGDWAGNGLTLFTPTQGRQWPQSADRAAALGRLAIEAAKRGDWIDAAEALPVYVRDKVALTTAERAAA